MSMFAETLSPLRRHEVEDRQDGSKKVGDEKLKGQERKEDFFHSRFILPHILNQFRLVCERKNDLLDRGILEVYFPWKKGLSIASLKRCRKVMANTFDINNPCNPAPSRFT